MARNSRYGTTGTRGPKRVRRVRKPSHGGGQHAAAAHRVGREKGGHVTAPPPAPSTSASHGGGQHATAASRVGRSNKGHVTLDRKQQLRNDARNARRRQEAADAQRLRVHRRAHDARESDDGGGGGIFDKIGDAASAVAHAGPKIDRAVEGLVPGTGAIHRRATTPIVSLPDSSVVGLAKGEGFNKKFDVTPMDAALAAIGGAATAKAGLKALQRTAAEVKATSKVVEAAPKPSPASSKLTPMRAVNDDHELMAPRAADEGASTAKPAKPSVRARIRRRVENRPRPYQRAKAKAKEGVQKHTPERVKSASAKAERAAKKAAKSKAGKAARVGTKPIRVPLKAAGKHPVLTTAGTLEAPGAIAAAQGKGKGNLGDKLTAPVVGTADALLHPGKTGPATLHALESSIAAPLGIAQNLALSGGRAASTGAHELGIPGAHGYSGAEIGAPTKESAKALADFAKEYAAVYGSGDPKRISEATQKEFGLGMLLPLLGAARARSVRAGRVAENPELGMGRVPGIGKKVVARRVNRQTSRGHRRGEAEAHVLGEAPGLRTDKVLGVRGRRKNKLSESEKAAVAAAAKSGAKTPEHLAADQAARNNGLKHGEAKTGTQTIHDVPVEAVNNPRVREATEITREEQRASTHFDENGKPISELKRLESVIITDPKNILAKDRTLPAGTKIEGRPLTKETGYFKNPKNERQRAINAKLEKLTIDRANKFIEETGRDQPVYIKSVPADRTPMSSDNVDVVPRGTRGRSSNVRIHRSEGKLNEAGLEDLGYEAMKVHSFYEPRAKLALNTAGARAVEEQAINVPVLGKDLVPRARGAKARKAVTDAQKESILELLKRDKKDLTGPQRQMVADLNAQGIKGPRDILFLDMQSSKAAVMDKRGGMVETDIGGGSAQGALEQIAKERIGGVAKGPAWIPVPRTFGEQWLAQHGKLTNKWYQQVGQGLLPTQRIASKALLGYSPSWLLAQPVAEAAQALAAVGPVQLLKGNRRFKELDTVTQRKVNSLVGQTAGTNQIFRSLTDVRAPGSKGKLMDTPARRVIQGLATGRYANAIDRTKGLAIRRAVLLGHMEREFNGFTGAMNKVLHEQTKVDKMMRDRTPIQRIEYMTKHPEVAKRMEGYLDDVMGNWGAMTTNERALSGVVIFYPFVRMSLEWSLLSYPARHPLKAAALTFLAEQNAQQVDNLLGGKPSFFAQWATAPLYGGTGKHLGEATAMSPLQRVGIGSNALMEAIGTGADPRAFLRGTNPLVASLFSSLGQFDPSTGRSQSEKYSTPSFLDFIKSEAGALGTLPSPARIADTVTGRKATRYLKGQQNTPTTKKFDSLSDHQLLRALVPLVPLTTSKERSKAELGRLIERAHAGNVDNFDIAKSAEAAAEAIAGNPKATQKEFLDALDALVAKNVVARATGGSTFENTIKDLASKKGITYDQAKNLVYGPSLTTPLPKGWNDIMGAAQKAGFSPRKLRKARRARARSLQGNNWTAAQAKAQRLKR